MRVIYFSTHFYIKLYELKTENKDKGSRQKRLQFDRKTKMLSNPSMFDIVEQQKTLLQQRADNVWLLPAVHAHVTCDAVQQDTDGYRERVCGHVINEVRTQRRQVVELDEIIIVTYRHQTQQDTDGYRERVCVHVIDEVRTQRRQVIRAWWNHHRNLKNVKSSRAIRPIERRWSPFH